MWMEGGEAETRKRSYQRSRRSDHKYAMMKMTDGRTDGRRKGRRAGRDGGETTADIVGRTDGRGVADVDDGSERVCLYAPFAHRAGRAVSQSVHLVT